MINCKKKLYLITAFAAILVLLSLQSCFKEKPLPPPGNQSIGQTAMIEMGPGYANQFFYSLETNSVISQNDRNAYDLMFDCNANQYQIWLNSAKFMSVVKTDSENMDDVMPNDTIGKDWHYEFGAYITDSCAIGQWWDTLNPEPVSAGKVYIIQLGLDANGESLGYIKMKVSGYSNNEYTISCQRFNETTPQTYTITKDPTRNYAYLSFTNNIGVLTGIEPDKALWDFCFTRYSVVFYDPYYLPYLVTGVLHNPSKVSAYMDSTVNFESISIADFETQRLDKRRDAVGYGWKRFTNSDYTTLPSHVFFIKTSELDYYKLRFIDFKKGNAWGYPSFEFYKL